MKYKETEQELFWRGNFGAEYTQRVQGDHFVANNLAFFSKVLENTGEIKSAIEFGANVGLNLRALKMLFPAIKLTGVEINENAVAKLKQLNDINVCHTSILDYSSKEKFDFVVSKCFLIHVNQERLEDAYNVLYESTSKYLCVAEYYSPMPVVVEYRGNANKLFKRDFAGELLDKFKDLKLISYGFVYHRDFFTQDDVTWFLLEKK